MVSWAKAEGGDNSRVGPYRVSSGRDMVEITDYLPHVNCVERVG